MISLKDVSKTAKVKHTNVVLLDNVTLHIEKGEIFGLIGHSQLEKSTLLRCINLLERPTQGNVCVQQQNLTLLPAIMLNDMRRKMGMIFTKPKLLSTRTVFENIALPLEVAHYTRLEIEEMVSATLDRLGLTSKSMCYPDELSCLEQHLVALGRAVCHKPHVLLCDNPTQGLDAKATSHYLAVLKAHCHPDLSLIINSHHIEALKNLCDRIGVLHQGHLIEQASVLEFFTNPKSTVGREFVRSVAKQDLAISTKRTLQNTPQDDSAPLFKISFFNQIAIEPLISHLIQQFHLTVNVLQAFSEHIQTETIAVMYLEFHGNRDTIEKGLAFLTAKKVFAEKIGYVPRTH